MGDDLSRCDPPSVERPLRKLLSIPPPVSPDDDNLDSPPASILIDPHGYISAHENDSTAEGFTSGKLLIRVTFWIASPPRVSCFTVHCPTLPQESVPAVFGYLPMILNTVEDLVLFRIAISPDCGDEVCPDSDEYFVYQAGGIKKRPSLHPILVPPYLEFSDHEPVLLPGRGMFFVAILHRRPSNREQFDVHLYNSETRKWCTKMMQSPQEEFDYSYSSKAITIGGELGSVGWVDLEHGILIYDVLLDNNYLRYIPLPSTVLPRKLSSPVLTRDIIVVNGFIKFLDMKTYVKLANSEYTPDGWEAATWILDISKNDSNWDDDCKINVSDVSLKDTGYARMLHNPRNADVLPNLNEGEDTEPSLTRFYASYPALSLHDDGVVHIMNRLKPLDDMAWMVSVDMKKQTPKGVAFFSNGRPVGYGFNFIESGISKHLTRNKHFDEKITNSSEQVGDMMQSDNDLLQKDVQPQSNAKGTRRRRRVNTAQKTHRR